jgi:protein ImuB
MLWLCLYLPPEARADRAALEGIANWAYQYTDRLTLVERGEFRAVLAEIEGSIKLFGGLSALRTRILTGFAAFGLPFRSAIAPTPAAAEALALAGHDAPVALRAHLPAALARLPLEALDLPARTLEALRGVGLTAAGECLQLWTPAIAKRFGADTVRYLRRLTGEAADPRPPYVPAPGWARRFALDHPCEHFEPLGFIVKRLLLELEGVLVARDTAVLRLALTLEHEDAPATVLELPLTAPRRDAPALLDLVRERLSRLASPPVTALVLEVTQFAENAAGQHDLFDPRLKQGIAAQALVERLAARLGESAVQGLELREDHRPEKGFGTHPYMPGGAAAPANDARGAQPFWLLPSPRALRAPPAQLGSAQRIETGWWDEAGIARDYFVTETPAGERLWVFRERGQWFLHGIWA